MVLLTMNSAMVEALELIQVLKKSEDDKSRPCVLEKEDGLGGRLKEPREDRIEDRKSVERSEAQEKPARNNEGVTKKVAALTTSEPSLLSPKIGNPVSHGQLLDLAKEMETLGLEPCRLEILLRGSEVYVPPPPPKPEPTSEYKALMARLRREEEARSYQRMMNPPPPMETFSQRFPGASAAHAFSANHAQTEPEDEVVYADINRQMSVILNVLVSIVACAAAIWIAARWWSTPMRLALSMSGSMLVGVAEVVVYAGYIRRVGEAKGKEKNLREVKEVVNTWVVGPVKDEKENITQEPVAIESKDERDEFKARKRK